MHQQAVAVRLPEGRTVHWWPGRHREKVLCPQCRQAKNALWSITPDGFLALTFTTHRKQPWLAKGEQPIRCGQSGEQLAITTPEPAEASA